MSTDFSAQLPIEVGPLLPPAPWLVAPARILVVDDDHAIRELVGRTLEEAGYHVFHADDGDQALVTLRQNAGIALVFLDMLLPTITGWEVMREMAADEDLRRIRVVFMTALPTPTGTFEWLCKPFDGDGVLRFAERHLGPAR